MNAPLPFAGWTWQPAFEPWVIVAGALALVALSFAAYARAKLPMIARVSLLTMRTLGVAAIAVVLLGPSAIPPTAPDQSKPCLDVLVDTSQSMLVDDAGEGGSAGRSRLAAALATWLSPEQLTRLEAEYRVRIFAFDADVRPLPYLAERALEHDDELIAALATGQQTRLAASTSSALGQSPGGKGAALLVLSDGRDTDDADVQGIGSLARSREIPIHTVAFGSPRFQRDLALFASVEQEYLLPREPGAIRVKVYRTGLDVESISVRLRRGDEEALTPVAFRGARVVEVVLPIQHEEAGSYEYTVSVDADPNELETANNKQIVFCDVAPKRIKVLALEGKPFWDGKFLAQSLRKDDRLELTQITQLSPEKRETITTRVEGGAASIPKTVDEWAVYDVVILGQGFDRMATPDAAKALTTFVERGGCVVFSRGAPYSRSAADDDLALALRPIEPVVWGEEVVRDSPLEATAAGRVSPWLQTGRSGLDVEAALERLPSPTSLTVPERVKPGALVLLQTVSQSRDAAAQNPMLAEAAPAIISMTYGEGTVVAVTAEGLWKWSLTAKREKDEGLSGFYDAFWSNLVRWLALGGEFQPGRAVSLQLSKTTLRLGEPLTVDVVCRVEPPNGIAPTLELISPDGSRRAVALTRTSGRDPRFRATIEPPGAGVYNIEAFVPGVSSDKLNKRVQVYDLNVERLDLSADPARLAVLAEQSGGKVLAPGDFEKFLSETHRERAASVTPPRPEFIWDRWEVMTFLLCWLGAEWILRRLFDLP